MAIERYNLTDHIVKMLRGEMEPDDVTAEMVKYISRLEQALDRANGWSHYRAADEG